jgi:hypothetical protein
MVATFHQMTDTSDLVERLRKHAYPGHPWNLLAIEAADTIQRLEAEREWWRGQYNSSADSLGEQITALQSERDRLKEELASAMRLQTAINEQRAALAGKD